MVLSNSPLKEIPKDYSPGAEYDCWFKIPAGPDKGKQMYYYDYNHKNKSQGVVLLVHGNPECSYTYRHIRDEIIKNQPTSRVIAMDHIGFGISDQATYEMVEIHHAQNLTYLIEELDLTNIQLVIHDWGGPIGIGSLIDMPERVSSIVVLNSTVFPMPKEGYTYTNFPFKTLPWAITPNIIPASLWGGVAGYVVSNANPQGFFTFTWNVIVRLMKHAFQTFEKESPEYVWSQMLRSTINAKSSKRQVRQTPVWGHGYEYQDKTVGLVSNKQFYQNIQDTIAQKWGAKGANIPIAGFFGMWDACGKKEVIDQWMVALPRIQEHLFTYEDIGHFIEEYKGAEIAKFLCQ